MLGNNKLGMLNSSPPGAGGVARSAEGVEIIFKVQCYGEAGSRYEKNRFNHNTPSPLRGTSPILGEELFVLGNNKLGAETALSLR